MSSKIKVDTIENVAGSGNVSLGSGHNLVVPGNITGSGAATITGDLTVDTSTLKVDSSNNRVGIGTASPGRKLELNNGGTGSFVTFTDGVATNFTFKTDGNQVGTFGTEAGSTHLAFMASGTERMRISSNGYVTKGKTAAFFIGGTSAVTVPNSGGTGIVTYTSGNILTSSTEIDPDNVFDHSTGKYTAPVAGDYYFCFSIGVSYSSNYHYSYIRKNNADVSGVYRNSAQNSDYIVNTIQCVLTLAENDYVTCARNSNYNGGAVVAPMFSGFLLG